VDAWWSGDPRVERFAADFQAAAGRAPMVLDAMAWDVTRLAAEALTEAGADRAVARKLLGDVRIPNPVAGGDHFGPARDVERKLYILTVDSSGIMPAELPQPPIPEELEAPL
jgi:ABC-type branched-subunit amino acid transport system substrate-binding protein